MQRNHKYSHKWSHRCLQRTPGDNANDQNPREDDKKVEKRSIGTHTGRCNTILVVPSKAKCYRYIEKDFFSKGCPNLRLLFEFVIKRSNYFGPMKFIF